jgi:S-adenosylmethionine:tRNA ribosyltransferase-isomerase
LRLRDFLYDLPEELIAQAPLEDRAASRLLVLDRRTGEVHHRNFADVADILEPGDLLVMNDTRVSALRLFGHRASGGAVEALLVQDLGGGEFIALVRPAKKLKPGGSIAFDGGLEATVVADEGEGRRLLRFEQGDYEQRLHSVGRIPLPPYIKGEIEDPERYQTVYARSAGSAASPTAGLHFTSGLLERLRDNGVDTATVTLDVSLDTFRPIQTDDVEHHAMHGERCSVPEETAKKVAECKGRVVAVGTTTVRTLESFAVAHRTLDHGSQLSRLFIKPGYEFKAVDAMFTNFHLPGTTMMLLVSALAGRQSVLRAYSQAVEDRYRFLSFGDSMLVL